jgi:hypothetical protein
VRWIQGIFRTYVEAEAAKVRRRAEELAPRNRGRLASSTPEPLFSATYQVPIPVPILDPTLVNRGVIDVPADVDADGVVAALRDLADEALRAPPASPVILTRKANGEPVLSASPGWYAPPGCRHETEIEVDSAVTGEIVARYCDACGRVEYAEGW